MTSGACISFSDNFVVTATSGNCRNPQQHCTVPAAPGLVGEAMETTIGILIRHATDNCGKN
jgi:hypothetical protein